MVVCSKHFKESDFTKTALRNRRLRPDALPSLCLPLSSTESRDVVIKKEEYQKERAERYVTLSRKREETVVPNNAIVEDSPDAALNGLSKSFEEMSLQDKATEEVLEAADILINFSTAIPLQRQ